MMHTARLADVPRRLRPVVVPATVIVVALLVSACSGRPGTGPKLNWDYFFDTLFRPDDKIRFGIWLTVSIAVLSQSIGVVLGTFAALAKLSRVRPFRWLANLYIWLFRGTPLVVQIVLFYFGFSVAKIYGWPDLVVPGAKIDGAIQAGVFALGVNEGAYFAEIVRAGILSIDPGQTEAGKALGMRYGQIMRRIVLPQAARVIVPPLGNEFNNMLKTTSLLVLISVPELYTIVNRKQGNVFAPFEFYLAAAVWYLLMTTIWSVIQSWIEAKLAKGTTGVTPGPSLRERLFGGAARTPGEVPAITGGR
jgi:polar amino acid transport system permease protein